MDDFLSMGTLTDMYFLIIESPVPMGLFRRQSIFGFWSPAAKTTGY